MRRFDPKAYVSNVEKYKVTDLGLVPPMVLSIVMTQPQAKKAFPSVRHALSGAAPLDKDLQRRFNDLLPPGVPFAQVWGMTEVSAIGSHLRYPLLDDTASVGHFLPNLDVKLVDDDGKTLASKYDTRGELCIRGPSVIRGYLDNPEANARDWDDEGYFHSGDIMYCDATTNKWYVVDRKKELIKVRGFQVAPNELEGVILGHPGVVDAAVIGLRVQGSDSELPCAYVVRKPDASVTEQDIKKCVSDRLIKYKHLEGGVVFVDAIPRNPSGKILKRLLREQAQRAVGARL